MFGIKLGVLDAHGCVGMTAEDTGAINPNAGRRQAWRAHSAWLTLHVTANECTWESGG